MAFLSELDVINDMLATLGESPLNSLDDDHDLVAAGRRTLKVASAREQAKGWWFNKEVITLSPDATSGFVYTPADAISVDPQWPNAHCVQRGRRLYNPLKNTYVFTTDVLCNLIRAVPFEDLPPMAATYVAAAAVLTFQSAYDADPQKTQGIAQVMSRALLDLNAEHTRNTKANMFDNPSTALKIARLGSSPVLGGLRN